MAQIAYILLCHTAPEAVIAQARMLVSAGDFVVLHYDARSPRADFQKIRDALADDVRVDFAPRVRCGWGQWSLVQATLGAARVALKSFPEATHLYAVSGDCLPIRSAEEIHARLDAEDVDRIESVDFYTSGWIRTGLTDERLIYRHHFNERSQKRLFYLAIEVQKRLGLARAVPRGLAMMIGSQWWCLRRATIEAVLGFIARRPDVVRFFRTTWIPDETFFQTLVRHLVPDAQIRPHSPTFLMFTDYGMPVTFHNDHHDLLISQDRFFFARKISPGARELRARLTERFSATGLAPPAATDGKRLHWFLTTRGREGHRFAPRAWEPLVPGPGRRLYLVVCKKWHIGKAVAAALGQRLGVPALDYVFDELTCPLPDLGGLGSTVEKRRRDRRAFVDALFAALRAERLILCLDPSDFDTIAELHGAGTSSRLLEVECTFDDAYLEGHAERIGLSAPGAQPIGPALLAELRNEVARLATARFVEHHRIGAARGVQRNAAALAEFLDIAPARALEIARTEAFLAD